MRRKWITGAGVTACAVLIGALAPSAAHAGNWMQVSCVNPNGSSAPSDGWTSGTGGSSPGYGSNTSTNCAASSPMLAILSDDAPAPVGANEILQYVPPAGSMLVHRLWKTLTRHVFRAGERELFTFTAPGLLPELSELIIRRDRKPVSKPL